MASENETHAEIVREMNCSHEGMIAFEFQHYASRIEAAHKREIEFYKQLLMTSQCALEDEIVKNQEHRREIAELRECLTEAEEFAAEMKKSTNSLVRACGHQMILRLRGEGAKDEN